MKYPIGMQSFDQIINGGFVYVDKTDLVYKLAQGHVCFLGRPRRFGKSLLVSTLENYFPITCQVAYLWQQTCDCASTIPGISRLILRISPFGCHNQANWFFRPA